MIRSVLVLCHGNVNRSAACAEILRAEGVEAVESAGLSESAARGHRAAKKMRDAMAEHGYDLRDHRSQRVTPEMLERAGLVIYMDAANLRRLRLELEELSHLPAVACLGSYIGLSRVADPGFMPRDSDEFRSVVDQLVRASRALANALKTGENRR